MQRPGHATSGYTLIELLLVLFLLGVLLSVAFRPITRWRDQAAVHAARDELAAALAHTRMIAVSAAGATLVLTPATGRFSTRTHAGTVGPPVDLGARYRVGVDAGAGDSVAFHYDALGIGRLTNRTVRMKRGAAEAGITVSAYGRYRRW
jgi:prepilin-type N-terminal cleavage/methylation domain-containing protein